MRTPAVKPLTKAENAITTQESAHTQPSQGSTPSGVCVDIFDGDNNINGAPTEPLAAGKSLTFGWALSCPGNAGDELAVKLLSGETALIEAKGKLS